MSLIGSKCPYKEYFNASLLQTLVSEVFTTNHITKSKFFTNDRSQKVRKQEQSSPANSSDIKSETNSISNPKTEDGKENQLQPSTSEQTSEKKQGWKSAAFLQNYALWKS